MISFAAARQTGGSNPKVSRDKSSREAGEKTVLTHEPQNLSGYGRLARLMTLTSLICTDLSKR